MQLNWTKQPRYQDIDSTEYRAWGINWPYRIIVSHDYVVLEKLGSGRKPSKILRPLATAFESAAALAQAWENTDQRNHDALGLVKIKH